MRGSPVNIPSPGVCRCGGKEAARCGICTVGRSFDLFRGGPAAIASRQQHRALQILVDWVVRQPDAEQDFFERKPRYDALPLPVLKDRHALFWQVDEVENVALGDLTGEAPAELINLLADRFRLAERGLVEPFIER